MPGSIVRVICVLMFMLVFGNMLGGLRGLWRGRFCVQVGGGIDQLIEQEKKRKKKVVLCVV